MIYILEGPDGVGKSTLASEIAEQRKASVLHCTFKPGWDIKKHHMDMWAAAQLISQYMDVVIDRWAPSELVYGTVFRERPSYDVLGLLWEMQDDFNDVKWIICENEHAVENHIKHKENREEMFDDMTDIVEMFETVVDGTPDLNWLHYDYDKVNIKEFVNNL